jgi:hypothetical protein
MKCSTIATLGMAKEYNGLKENSCMFSYKGTEAYMTLSPENKFYCKSGVDVTILINVLGDIHSF